ncbi:antigen 5 like allergen Cul n 1 [Drosophila grimshawi]|uniref:Venom allergen-1 n=1 Tax=Drosophila grimshawi TaxID=7222 RepID=B4JMF4_DROGR|nr:antigen 5 like allergen Cul n 1 [Drosophila grimshawi]EDV92479.1 GH24944 [Drosophila grimshawi]
MLRLSGKCTPGLLPAGAVLLVMQLIPLVSATTTLAPSTPQAPSPPTDYCAPALCEIFNGSHLLQLPHTACGNNGSFGASCGPQPKLLYMSDRRRQLLLDMHNLVRSKIAAGEVPGYEAALHMPFLRWDEELAQMAALHAKRCQFAHDQCRNTQRFQISGQNIGYFWIGREFKSHSRRMKSFVLHWFREYKDANQSYIDSFQRHPEGKKIGHFTLLVADRVRRVGCAAVRFLEQSTNRFQFLLTCNYDYNNIFGDPVYKSGPTASKCAYRISKKYPALCDWKSDASNSDTEEILEDNNTLDNNIPV